MTPSLRPNQQQQQQHQQQQQYYNSSSSSNSKFTDQKSYLPRYGYEDMFDIDKQVKELDRQLAIVRSSPPKVLFFKLFLIKMCVLMGIQ